MFKIFIAQKFHNHNESNKYVGPLKIYPCQRIDYRGSRAYIKYIHTTLILPPPPQKKKKKKKKKTTTNKKKHNYLKRIGI